MVSLYWTNLLSVVAYLLIVLVTCLTTAMLALFCSVLFRKTSHAMMTTYLVIIVMFCTPLAVSYFARTVVRYDDRTAKELQQTMQRIDSASFTSPFAAAFAVPLDMGLATDNRPAAAAAEAAIGNWRLFFGHVAFSLGLNALLLLVMMWLFNTRWRVAG
jgi:hypothetical protein